MDKVPGGCESLGAGGDHQGRLPAGGSLKGEPEAEYGQPGGGQVGESRWEGG